MQLRTRDTLVARKHADETVTIYVPADEFVEAETSDPTCRQPILWRGQRLVVEPADLRRATERRLKPTPERR